MRGRKAEANLLLLLLLFLSTLWGAQEQTVRISCLNWDAVTQWPKCLPAWTKGCCNSCWDMRCPQARTSEEKRKINLLVSDTASVHRSHLQTICPWAVSECRYLSRTHVLALGISEQLCTGCECAGVVQVLLPHVWVVVYEVMAGCTLSTGWEYTVLFVPVVDGWDCPLCLAGRT